MNPFINNKSKIVELLGTEPSNVQLEIAWEQLIKWLDYNPLFEENREERGEVGHSNIIYPKPRPISLVRSVEINDRNIADFELYKNEIILKIPKNNHYQEFPFEPYELNRYRTIFDAGYLESELPSSFYLAGALLLQIYNGEKELVSYSIDTISETYAESSLTKQLMSVLGGL